MFAILLGGALVLAGCAQEQSWGPGCEMHAVAELPLLTDPSPGLMVPVVPASVDGRPVAFIVDTGARVSVMFDDAVLRLGLHPDLDHTLTLSGIEGQVFSHPVTVSALSIGAATAHDVVFQSFPESAERTVAGLPVVGLFGGNFLASYDVAVDLPAHRVTLYTEHGCTDNLQPWAEGDFSRIPFDIGDDTAVILPLTIDGHMIPVQLDTGASVTLFNGLDLRQAGIDTAAASQRSGSVRGIGVGHVAAHRHTFRTIVIGDEQTAPATCAVADLAGRSLLGADYLRDHRAWISYPHRVLYLQHVVGAAR